MMTAEIICNECKKRYRDEDVIRYSKAAICGACKPIFLQRLKEGAAIPGLWHYGGFGIRLAAKIIDGVILTIISWTISIITLMPFGGEEFGAQFLIQMVSSLVQMGIAVAYNTWFVGKYGATPGKMACGLRIILPDGEPVSYGRACGRAFAEYLSSFTLLIGYLIAIFDEERKTLHDIICNTRVVHV